MDLKRIPLDALIRELIRRRAFSGRMHPEYNAWSSMKDRCSNSKSKYYHRYGGRGIRVCKRWRDSFAAFLKDMGPRPTRLHTLDRKHNDKNYCKSNCRWATRREQANNRSNNRFLTFRGRKQSLAAWARETRINEDTLRHRLKYGWTPEQTLTREPHYGQRPA